MQLYLPIAEMAVSADTILLLSVAVGVLSGMYGIGGGFLATPFLIFMGIPPAIAVGTQATQLTASAVSGSLAHLGKGHVDTKIGMVMVAGGLIGAFAGVFLFKILKALGQIDFAVSILYVLLLGSIGMLMLYESVSSLLIKPRGIAAEFNSMKLAAFIDKLPYKMRFPRSRLYVSVLVPGAIGFWAGLLNAILGIGGGFVIVPAMIYLLGMPSLLVAGTSLFQIVFTASAATVMHSIANHSVDLMLASILIVGSVAGAQVGARIARHVRGRTARIMLALLILGVCFRMIGRLFIVPGAIFTAVSG